MNKTRLVTDTETAEPTARLAVLIDADNAQAAVSDGLFAEIARFGEATVRRIYGDFTSTASGQWKKVLNYHAIKPVQQFAYTTGKNATDSMLIIDAMDLLYTRRFDGFCLVSSDSDFTGLALRIREEGLRVIGFGEQKTPEAFRNACHRFVFTEFLQLSKSKASQAGAKNAASAAAPSAPAPLMAQRPEFPRKFVLEALEEASDDTGWTHLGSLGSYLAKLQPDFDSRLYGFKKLSDLVKGNADLFEWEERPIQGSSAKMLYVRPKAR